LSLVFGTKPRAPNDGPTWGSCARRRKINLPTVAPVSAAATTTAAATAATAAATTTTTATTGAAATEAAALGPLFSLVHSQGPTIERGTVHGFDRLLRLRGRAHGDEAKASRLTGGSIGHDVNIRHFPDAGKSLANRFVGGRE
jgi:hypothetical protein